MSLAGSLRTMSIGDLLEWIDRRFACGDLVLERGPAERSFHFDSGYATSASSNDAADHLGQMLIRRGLIDEGALTDAFKVQGDTGVQLGKILLMVGGVDETGLREALEDKIRESLYDALTWTEGSFRFEPDPPNRAVSSFEVSVNLGLAISEGQRRAQDLQRIRALIPSDDTPLRVAEPGWRDRVPAGEPAARWIEALAGGATIGQLTLEHRGSSFQVLATLADLIESGILAVEQRRAPRAPDDQASAADLERAARGRAAGGDRAGALELARRALALAPESPAMQKLHRELERALFAELSRDLLGRFCVPRLLKSADELARLDMTDEERYLTGRIDGRWDLLSLMRISPLREVEILITFKRLADRGIVAL